MTKRTVKQNANELHDAEVSWISLVDRPANRIPFRIMKAENIDAKRSNTMVNLGLAGLFNTSKEEVKAAPSISAIVLKAEDQERMLPMLAEAGFTTDDLITDQEGIVIVKQEEFDAENVVTVRLKNETAVILSHVDKAFTPYPETLSFDEKLKASGFFPSVSMATEALMDTITEIMYDARSPEDVKTKMDIAVGEYSTFVSGLASALPVAAFKVESLEMKDSEDATAEAVKDEDGSKDIAKDADTEATEAVKEEEAPADETPAKDAVKEEHGDECPEGEEMKDGKCQSKKEDDKGATEDEVVAKDETSEGTEVDKEVAKEGTGEDSKMDQLIGLVASLKSDLDDGLKAVRDDVEKVKSDTEGYANRIEQVEATAKSAETAVKGTVVAGSEAGSDNGASEEYVEYDSAVSRMKSESNPDSLWADSPVAKMLG